MFAHIDRRISGRAGFATKSGRRQIYAAIAILGLYIQLIAGGLCMGGALPGSLGAFAICHTNVDSSAPSDLRSNPSDHAPAPQHSCPFCAIHCHAAIAAAPAIGGAEHRVAIASPLKAAPFVLFSAARFFAGTPPRGPPASA